MTYTKQIFGISLAVIMVLGSVPLGFSEPIPELPFLQQRISVDIHNDQYYLYYNATNVSVNSVHADLNFISLVFDLDVLTDGFLIIDFDREIFGSSFNEVDDDFIILADGDESTFTEIQTNSQSRTLSIELSAGTEQVEIIGSYFITSANELKLTDKDLQKFEKKIQNWNIKIQKLEKIAEKFELKGKIEKSDYLLFKATIYESMIEQLEKLIYN